MWFGESVIAVRYKLLLFLLIWAPNAFAQSVHIFISFSMPNTSISQWLMQGEQTQTPIHIRGFVDNSFKQTLQAANELLKKDNHPGFLLDPKLFEQYHIDKVPAVVFVEDNQEYAVVYGDIGLKAAAEIASSRTNSTAAKEILKKL